MADLGLDISSQLVEFTNIFAFQLFDNHEKDRKSRLEHWKKIRKLIAPLSNPLRKMITAHHTDLVEIILNNLSTSTFSSSKMEWVYTCDCLLYLLEAAGRSFWKIVQYDMTDVVDDIIDVLSSVTKDSSSSDKNLAPTESPDALFATAFSLLEKLVMSSDDISSSQIDSLLLHTESMLKRKKPVEKIYKIFNNSDADIAVAISGFTNVLIEKELQSLIQVHCLGSSESLGVVSNSYNVIFVSCQYFCRLCEISSSLMLLKCHLYSLKIQSALLESSKWIVCISEEYIRKTDSKLKNDSKIFPLISRQQNRLGNLLATISAELRSSCDSKDVMDSSHSFHLKKMLKSVPACMLSCNSNLKQASLRLLQDLSFLISSRKPIDHLLSSPMKIFDPLLDSPCYFMHSRLVGNKCNVSCTSSNLTQLFMDSLARLTAMMSQVLSSPSQQNGFNSGMNQVGLFDTAIKELTVLIEQLRQVLHKVNDAIERFFRDNEMKNPQPDYTTVSWQELYYIKIPQLESSLRSLHAQAHMPGTLECECKNPVGMKPAVEPPGTANNPIILQDHGASDNSKLANEVGKMERPAGAQSRTGVIRNDNQSKYNQPPITERSRHVVKGGSEALKQRLMAREHSERMNKRCRSVEDYQNDLQDEDYQERQPKSNACYQKRVNQVTDTYSYNSFRRTEGFDDFRRSNKRGCVGSENGEGESDTFMSRKLHRSVGPEENLDAFGDMNAFADLDKGYELDFERKKPKAKPIVTPNISDLLGKYSAAVSKPRSSSQQSTVINTKKSLHRGTDDSKLTMMQKMSQVSIDDFYVRLLSCKLDDLRTASRTSFNKAPIRFLNEDQYIKTFQPLLEAEMEAMLAESITSCLFGNKRGNRRFDYSNSNAQSISENSFPRVFVQCVMIQPRSTEFLNSTPLRKDAKAEESTASLSNISSSNGLEDIRVSLVQQHNYRNAAQCALNRDDLVLIVDVCSMKGDINDGKFQDLFTLPHFLGIVASQHSHENGSNESTVYGKDSSQHTIVALKDSYPSSSSTWICVPFASLATHTREWKALHSIRSHSLIPLVPYLLKASPVVSASRLQSMYQNIEKGISGIVENDSGRQSSSEKKKMIDEKAKEVLQLLKELDTINVDFSVLSVTNMPEKLKALSNRKGLDRQQNVVASLKSIRSRWKDSCKHSHRESTIRNLKGGNVITASGNDLLQPPQAVPSNLWRVLSRIHNQTQLFAIRHVVSCMRGISDENDTRICLIQGPPGTGKTRTILGMVSTLMHLKTNQSDKVLQTSNRILVCAPSNAAVDEVLLRLKNEGVINQNGKTIRPKLVRLGKPLDDSPQDIIDMTLENQVEALLHRDPCWKKLQHATETASSLKQQLFNLGKSTDAINQNGSDEKRRQLRSELRLAKGSRVSAELAVTLRRAAYRKTVLEDCNVLAGTLSAAGQYTVLDHVQQHDIRFETVLVDEAAQATEPATLIPLRYGCKTLVLVGDPRQLPAYVASQAAESAGLGVSLFERLERAGHTVVMLSVQYRMHPFISSFPSKLFYDDKLRDGHRIQMECNAASENSDACEKAKSRVTTPLCRLNSPRHLSPVTLFDIYGKEELMGKSYKNSTEAKFIFSLLASLRSASIMGSYTVGILSPYKGQVTHMKSILQMSTSDDSAFGNLNGLNIEVNTIDGFQGREKDIIVLSTVRCQSRGVGFLSDIRRLNVAITRAKKCLIIAGSTATLEQDATWSSYLKMLREAGVVVPGPRSGHFADYAGYPQLMETIRSLSGQENRNCPSDFEEGEIVEGVNAHHEISTSH